MKRIVFSILAFLLSVIAMSAESMKIVHLSFNKSQFSFIKDEFGAIEISAPNMNAGYDSDSSQAGLPFISVNVGVPNGVEFENVSISKTSKLVSDGVVVAANPIEIPTNYDGVLPKKSLPVYVQNHYPKESVKYVCTSIMDGYTILRFLVCPFEYDVQSKKLYFADNVTLNIKLTDSPSLMSFEDTSKGNNMRDIFMSQIINAEDFEESGLSTQGVSIGGELSPYKHITERYLIVTSNALAPYFKPLATWKTTKGIKAKIVTVEDIMSAQEEADTALAIKTYLYNEYKNNHLKYVLLGADDKTVPSRKCYYGYKPSEYKNIPSDLYYACFDNCFSWDANGNGIYGELSDNIGMTPSIIVTRAGVRDVEDVEAFVNKIIGYEKCPNVETWRNNILMCGAQRFSDLSQPSSGQSDAEVEGEKLYNSSIVPYWKGTRYRFYDTCTDFPGGSKYDLTPNNLQYEMSRGYTFFDMKTHGNREHWSLERGSLYLEGKADSLNNSNYTIMTTTACHTSSFSWKFRCLGEDFMRNPQSGVVAYLGCSREGWWSTSAKYEAEFYTNLFSDKVKSKKYGEVVAAAKSAMTNQCSIEDCARWVQLGLNPFGDPEMPIYTEIPEKFSNVSIKYSTDRKNLIVDTGVDSCNVCFMSVDDNGETAFYTLRDVRKATFQITSPTSVCITKQNYVPYVTTKLFFVSGMNKMTQCIVNPSNNTALVSAQLSSDVRDASIVVTSANGGIKETYSLPKDDSTLNINLSKLAKGVMTVSLVADGEIVDSRNIINNR